MEPLFRDKRHNLYVRTYPHTNCDITLPNYAIGVGVNSHSDLCRVRKLMLHKSRAH